MVKKLLEFFMKKNSKKQIKKNQEFRIEKVVKLYVKWKGYDNSFNSWIDKKYIQYFNIFLNHMKPLEEIVMLKLIYLITQQKQI